MESTDSTGQSQEPTTPTKADESSSSSTQVTPSSPQKAATPSATFVVASSSSAVSANTVGVTLNMSSASNPTSLVPTIAGSNSIAVSMAQQQQQQAASLQYVQLVQPHNNGIPFYQSSQQLQFQPSIVHLQSFSSLNTIPIMSQTTAQAAIPVAKPGRPQLTTGQLPIRPTPTASTASNRAMLPTQAFPQQAVVVNTVGSQQQTLALGNQLFTVNKTQKNLIQPRPTLTTIPTSGQFIGRGTTPQIISQQSFPMFQPAVQTFNPQLTYAQAAQPSFVNNLNHFQYLAPTQGLQTIPINTLQNNLQVATATPPATPTAQTNTTITSVSQGIQGNTPTNSTVTKLKPVAPRPATTTSTSIGTQAVASSTKLVSSTGTKKQSTIKSLTGGVGVSSTATSSTKSTISDKKTPTQDNKTSGTNSNRATSSTIAKASSEVVARVPMSATQNGVKPTPTAGDPKTSTPISKGVPPHLKGDVRKSTPTSSRSIEKRDASTGSGGTRANSHPLSHQSHPNNLRNGIRPQSTINSRAGVKIDKPSKPDQILVHVIEDFIIEESSKPFPINGMDSSIKENGGWVNSTSSTATSTVVSSPTPESSRKRGAVLDNEGECQICLKVGPKARLKLKNGLKVCPACASKKVPVPTASSSRLGVFNPVTSKGDKVSEYDFPDQESVNISGVKQEQLPSDPSDRKKPRLTKTTRASSTTTNVQQPKIDSVSSGSVLSNGATHVVPDSQSQPQKNDILAGLYIPASGMNPVKWNVQDVYDFIRHLEGCEDAANEFRSQEIDGQALMLLKEGHLITEMHIKIGPALKICSKINELKEATGKTST